MSLSECPPVLELRGRRIPQKTSGSAYETAVFTQRLDYIVSPPAAAAGRPQISARL